MRFFGDLKYSNAHDEKVDVYIPDSDGFKTIIYFHGGGLAKGDKATPSKVAIAEFFVSHGYAFASANYRMYPDARFPDFVEDAAEAVAFVRSFVPTVGGSGDIIISGSSAGAWLSVMLCLDKSYLAKHGIDTMEVLGWGIDSSQMTSHYNVMRQEHSLDKRLQRINEYAPLFYLDGDTRFTRMLLLFYEKDMPCRPEQNLLFYKAVLAFNENADIEYRQLAGKHCYGSSHKNENGEYEYATTMLDWLKRKGI